MNPDEVAELQKQLAELKVQLGAERERSSGLMKEAEQLERQGKARNVQPVYVATTRKLGQFCYRPVKNGDPRIADWIEDVRSQITLRGLEGQDRATFVIDHLSGQARQEVLGRGDAVKSNAAKIIQILRKVFGDGDNVAALQQKFFSYKQKPDQSLLDCSLELVDLFDRICQLDPSFGACKQTNLKGCLPEAVQDEALRREIRRLSPQVWISLICGTESTNGLEPPARSRQGK